MLYFLLLGLDGLNAYFFKKVWNVIQHQFCEAVQDYFNFRDMHFKVNIATITLISNLFNATSITDFRPIAYCSIIYKNISKIISNRL